MLVLIKELESNYLIFSIILNKFTISVYSYTLINNGGFTISFIDTDFAMLHYFFL